MRSARVLVPSVGPLGRRLFFRIGVVCIATVLGATAARAHPATDAQRPHRHADRPAALEGPFQAAPVEHVRVPGAGGTILDGYVHRPILPAGVGAPVILVSSPYFGSVYPQQDSVAINAIVPVDLWVSEGYAVALFNVRGTGSSEGCLEVFGPREQRDQALLVEWAGSRAWSSGRVAMVGTSYDATTAVEAAIQRPSALQTIVAAAPVFDAYTLFSTPQGAKWWLLQPQFAAAFGGISVAPPVLGENAAGHLANYPAGSGRLCDDVRDAFTNLVRDEVTDDRQRAFWDARNLLRRLEDVRAPVLLTEGYYDDQYFQADDAWGKLSRAPVEMIAGPWPHQPPPGDWNGKVLRWLDFWLKGEGPAPEGLNAVTWQDAERPGVAARDLVTGAGLPSGTWHRSEAWPPPEAARERLYPNGDALTSIPVSASVSYTSVPFPEGTSMPLLGPGGWWWPKAFVCSTNDAPGGSTRLLFRTEPADRPWLVAGNPAADLRIESDRPGGIVGVFLLDLPPGFCETDGPQDAALISFGAADLRFHEENFVGRDFPVGVPTKVHIDLSSIAQVIQPGHRLAALVGYGNPLDHGSRHLPAITLHGGSKNQASRFEIPVVEVGSRGR